MIKLGDETFDLDVLTTADTPRDDLDSEALAIYRMFGEREREFGFGPDVVIDYPPVDVTRRPATF